VIRKLRHSSLWECKKGIKGGIKGDVALFRKKKRGHRTLPTKSSREKRLNRVLFREVSGLTQHEASSWTTILRGAPGWAAFWAVCWPGVVRTERPRGQNPAPENFKGTRTRFGRNFKGVSTPATILPNPPMLRRKKRGGLDSVGDAKPRVVHLDLLFQGTDDWAPSGPVGLGEAGARAFGEGRSLRCRSRHGASRPEKFSYTESGECT
jgi:hypothetical protein